MPDGVRALGHEVLLEQPRDGGLRMRVRAGAVRQTSSLSDEELRRYARQIVLPDVGEAGQQALGAACVTIEGPATELEVLGRYLRAAGVGDVRPTERDAPLRATIGEQRIEAPTAPSHHRRATLLADQIQRRVVLGADAPPSPSG